MPKMFKSATRVTLISLIFALIALTFLGKLDSNVFEYVITAVVSFYFGQKSNPSKETEIQ